MHVSGSMSVRRATRSSRPWRGIAACTARMAPSSAHQSNKARHVVLGAAPNNSFKPNLLRYTKAMAEKACHGFASTTQVGLTQALGRMTELAVPLFIATIFLTPLVFGLVALLFRMLSSREPDIYAQLGSPSFIRDRNKAMVQAVHFLYSRMPGQLNDWAIFALAIMLRALLPLYVCTAIPFLYRLFLDSRAA